MQKENVKYRAVIYIRLSSADDKPGESDSVANQRRLIHEWLKGHPDIEVVAEKVDDGFSGLLFDRPAFKEMMADIEAGAVNCCVCKDLSRFGREHVGVGRYLRRIFPAYGVRFIAINDNIDTIRDSGDDLTVGLKNIINDAYCRDISVKTRSALDAKRANGDYVGACPVYGYVKSPDDRNQLVIDEHPAGIVRDIFRMKLDGLSASRIADELNGLGVLSPIEYKRAKGLPYQAGSFADKDGAKWSPTTVLRILGDETYTGTLLQGRVSTPNYKLKGPVSKPREEWRVTPDAHEAIVSRFCFDLAQKVMRLDTRTAPGEGRVHLFSGLLICGSCGGRMVRYTVPYPGNGNKYHYYRCPTGKKNGCGPPTAIKESVLAECVLQCVKAHVASVASVESILAGTDAERAGRELAARLAGQLSENERRLGEIRGFKAGLYEDMVNGVLTKDEYRAFKARYAEKTGVLTAANEKLRSEIDDALSCKHERMAWARHLRDFADIDAIDRRTVVHLIQAIHVLGKNEIRIDFNYRDEYENALASLEGVPV